MYSVVLAAMLTAGEVTPDFGRGCHGCYGGCHGCYGCGGCFGCYGCGGCFGCYGCSGCYGGCYGCWGCGGCYGCGGCFGCYGCGGCYGSCFGCYGCGGGCYGCHGGVVIIKQAPAPPKKEEKKDKKDKKTSVDEDRATVIVEVPADTGLFVQGQSVPMTSTTRTFTTPELEPGRTYYYNMKAVGDRNGLLVSQTKQVAIKAGETVRVEFRDLQAESGAAVARVSVRLPEDARLFVDGVACPLKSSKREFDTPKLEPGQKYSYTLKAEVVRDGQTLSEEKQVILQAGRKVEVDFNKLRSEAAASR